ncbi:phosphoribosyltransferase-like protein [Mycena epipterygia]|nr:phosphoribosyltransferase-like protein [Mycena epipterygia]
MSTDVEHLRVTYNDIHNLIRNSTPKIAKDFNPDLLVAIGSGGFFPARVMRTFLREETEHKALQIQAIGLSLYEPIEGTSVNQIGQEVVRTQWLGPNSGKLLLGRRNLIVDEVDDTRKTLHYALSELQKDVEEELLSHPESERPALREATKFGIFVVHNKNKGKLAELPTDTPYFAGATVEDVWLDYPWEAMDIEEHDRLALADRKL